MDGKSLNIANDKLEKLKQILPEAFTEGQVDWEKLRLALGEDINVQDERYVLNWAGKSEAFRALQTPTTATLAPAPEESVNFDSTENIFIEGENLEVLKILQKSYYGKVKMIYIDPPYNTGNDSFVYPDKFSESREEYLKRIQAKDEDGLMLKDGLFRANSKDSGHYHSNWLSMMYPRLFLARNLLREDGVIFVSIDDNEVHNLRLLMNDVFGEENFIANVIWQKIHSVKNDAKYFSDNHEYILIFSKNKDFCEIRLLPRTDAMNKRYKNPDNDPRGAWSSGDLVASEERSEGYYEVESPTGKKFNVPQGKHWVYSQKNMLELIKDNRVWFGKNDSAFPRLKRFLSEVQQGKKASTLWLSDEVGHNQEARRETKALFDDDDLFDTPKPIRLVSKFLTIGTKPTEKEIILDFFGGSSTTAQAVLRKNYKDCGNRKFIMVQLPENTNNEDFPTIAEIGKERIRRAAKKIHEELEAKKAKGEIKFDEEKQENSHLDLGFKVFKLDSSNIRSWDPETKDIEQSLWDSINNIKEDRKEEDVLYEVLLKYGLDLTLPIKEYTLAGKKVFSIGFGALITCLNDNITLEAVEEIGKLKNKLNPEICRVVFKDNGFNDDVTKTNAMQILKRYSIEEVVSI